MNRPQFVAPLLVNKSLFSTNSNHQHYCLFCFVNLKPSMIGVTEGFWLNPHEHTTQANVSIFSGMKRPLMMRGQVNADGAPTQLSYAVRRFQWTLRTGAPIKTALRTSATLLLGEAWRSMAKPRRRDVQPETTKHRMV